jgi:hypothetical protein
MTTKPLSVGKHSSAQSALEKCTQKIALVYSHACTCIPVSSPFISVSPAILPDFTSLIACLKERGVDQRNVAGKGGSEIINGHLAKAREKLLHRAGMRQRLTRYGICGRGRGTDCYGNFALRVVRIRFLVVSDVLAVESTPGEGTIRA